MIVIYHGVLPEGASSTRACIGQALPGMSVRQQILWAAAHFRIVPLSEYVTAPHANRRRKHVALTFDDGNKETFECIAPFLRSEGLPAALFVSTQHLCGGPLLWFSFLNALCFEGLYGEVAINGRQLRLSPLHNAKAARRELATMARASGRPADFSGRLAAAYPLPEDICERYGGMTDEQLAQAGKDDLIEIGSHTVTHPFLSDIPQVEQRREMIESKERLSVLTGRRVRLFAYPSGDYTSGAAHEAKTSGYDAAFATRPKNLGVNGFEIGRVGIYSPSMVKFRLKAHGFVEMAEAVGIRVG
jgi:peptidoglycan/xylan/chitin deacetylase (PgdA/CDA1 family)